MNKLDIVSDKLYKIRPESMMEFVHKLDVKKIKNISLDYEFSKEGLMILNWKYDSNYLFVLLYNLNPPQDNEYNIFGQGVKIFPTNKLLTVHF